MRVLDIAQLAVIEARQPYPARELQVIDDHENEEIAAQPVQYFNTSHGNTLTKSPPPLFGPSMSPVSPRTGPPAAYGRDSVLDLPPPSDARGVAQHPAAQ